MTRNEFMDIVYSELHSDGDNYRANRIIDAADEYAETKQQPKTGHWINKTKQSACGVIFYNIECSECGKSSGLSNTSSNYCPNCGAKMAEGEEA